MRNKRKNKKRNERKTEKQKEKNLFNLKRNSKKKTLRMITIFQNIRIGEQEKILKNLSEINGIQM